jgi:hypothetical protein
MRGLALGHPQWLSSADAEFMPIITAGVAVQAGRADLRRATSGSAHAPAGGGRWPSRLALNRRHVQAHH